MTGTRESLSAMIGELVGNKTVRRRILQTLFPLLLALPRRSNFKQQGKWSGRNEGTIHNWYKKDLGLLPFNCNLIDRHGSGDYIVIFDPSYLPKSGKHTPGLGHFWSGQAGAVKRGMEIGSFAVGDLGHRTAFHLSAELTPSKSELVKIKSTQLGHYLGLVEKHRGQIEHFGGTLVCDGYFGVLPFVAPVVEMGIRLISCLKSNASLFYSPPALSGDKKKRGRPRKKGGKINWGNIDETLLPCVHADAEKRVRSAKVYVKCLKRAVQLVAVEYLRPDGSMICRKLYFCTDTQQNWHWVLERYGLRFQIEFIFRDAKQFLGLAHCQSTDKIKIENHVNLALSTVSIAKAAHYLPLESSERGAFSMAELKNYYYNLMLFERFSVALGINPTEYKNNPKIKELLFSTTYVALAA